ncbi:efflux RND transporter permease subunit [Pelagicoccus mobilis]|uniref:Efflux RND transporter permease subunit n=1 Tax=Pelagicoccus mobilis TaxID=415221 RepID=A0A934VTG7_9BACT|nr:efflux RND transporter permease subunit [Pelagicoccus mobilis]MBK1879698.1 efflux RND transporter permease subunit [Pelagicoccus mobilis]
MDFARVSIQKPVLTWLLIVASLLGGYWGFLKVGRLEDPAFTIKEAVVFTLYPGASAEEVEREVTDKIEAEIQRLGSVKEIRSRSYAGRSVIEVELLWTAGPDDIPQIWDELRRKVGDIQPMLPPGVRPTLVNDDFGDVYGLLYAVSSERVDYASLHRYVKRLKTQLMQVQDVADVQILGDISEELHVDISPEQMATFGLSPEELLSGITTQNAVTDAGGFQVGGRFARLQPTGMYRDVEELADLPIGRKAGEAYLKLGDVAEVSRGYEERPTRIVRFNGDNTILLGVAGRSKVNIVEVGKRVEARIAELENERPEGIDISPIYEQHAVVDKAVTGFVLNLAMSVVIVVGVLCVFMGWRSGLVVGGVLFLTVAATVFGMNILGIEMERISLGALIIAMGMLVDNAIVVAEGMLVRVQKGMDKLEAASAAVRSTWLPLIGATVVGILAFSGIGLSQDATGEFTFSLFVVIAVSLMLSWVFAVTVTPLLGNYILKKPDAQEDEVDPYKGILYSVYKSILGISLRFRILTVLALGLMAMGSLVGFRFVKQSFFPDSNTPVFYLNVWQPYGADIRATDEIACEVEQVLMADERVDDVTTLVGAGAQRFMLVYAPEQPDPSYMQFIIRTHDVLEIEGLIADIKPKIAKINPALFMKTERVRLGPGGGAKIEARIIGPDTVKLREISDRIQSVFVEDAQLEAVRTNWRELETVLVPEFDVDRAQLQGLSRARFAAQMKMLSEGSVFGVYREDDELIPVRVRLPEADRIDPRDMNNRLIWSPGRNGWVPLESVISGMELKSQEGLIRRKNRERTLTVEAEPVAGVLASSAFARVRPEVERLQLPDGYRLEWGGEYESSTEAQTALFKGLPLGYIGMLVVVVLLFGKVRQPIVVWSVVPMSIIGVTLGLLGTGVAFGFMALLGMISLTGMLLKNSIVLVDEIDARIGEGQPRYDALVDASVSRARPVILASVTTILGMAPLVFDAFFVGMAVTIMAGLAFATLLTLIAVPAIYSILFRIGRSETVTV